MLETKNQLTEQEHFWKGEFGDEYISRNEGLKLLAYKTYYFSSILKVSGKLIRSILKYIFYILILNKKKKEIYYQRFSGLLNSMRGKSSWYRPKL